MQLDRCRLESRILRACLEFASADLIDDQSPALECYVEFRCHHIRWVCIFTTSGLVTNLHSVGMG